jgi:superfamily II DNA or RNA helicase
VNVSTNDAAGDVCLRPYQERAITELEARIAAGRRRVVVVSPTGCHRAGQGVLRHDGSVVRVEDVNVGDRLMGPDSCPRTVGALCRGEGPMVRIVPVKGEPFVVNEDHVLTLVRTSDGKRPGGELVDVRVRDWMAWSRTAKHVHKLVRTGVSFPNVPGQLPVDPYFVGVLLGDGSICRNVTVCNVDPELIALAHVQAARFGLQVRSDPDGISHHLHGDIGKRNILVLLLRWLGIYGLDCETKFVPPLYLRGCRDTRLDVLAGLLDTDGSLAHGGYDFVSKSERLARDTAFLARSLGLAAYVASSRKRCQTGAEGSYWRVGISGDCSVIPSRLPRKTAPARRQKENVLRTGFAIEAVGVEPFFGFTLDGDGRYLLEDFTITHNSGKTVIAAEVVDRATARGHGTLVVAHRRELIQQTYDKLLRAGLNERQVGVVMASDARRRPMAPVQVASIDTLRHRSKPPADLVIVDECHRELARSYRELRAHYPDAIHLGFTATPYRADNRGLGEFYEDLLLVASIRELIDQGYLVEPRVFTVPPERLPNLAGVRVRAGDYAQDQLDAAVDQTTLVGDIVEHWIKHASGVRTVVFAVSVKHSKHIVERFREAGISAEHLDGTTPADERDAILTRLVSGETLVMSNVGILCEGTDLPPVKCAILARPTKSTGLYLQQAGRILRPWQGQRAIILDHAGCAREHGLPQEEREFSLEPKPKRKRGDVVQVPIRTCDGCQAVLPARLRVCPECGFFFAGERAVPSEREGQLVLAKPGEEPGGTDEGSERRKPRGEWNRALQRTVFEQLWALARAKKQNALWVRERFVERYGAPPPAEWVESAWGPL